MVDYWDWTLIDNDWSTVINAKMFFMYSRMVLYTCICTLLSKSSLLEEINPFDLWRVQLGVSSRRLIKKNIGNSRLHCGHLGWALIAEVMNNKMPSNFSKLGLIGMVDGECTGKDLIGACCDELAWARRAFFPSKWAIGWWCGSHQPVMLQLLLVSWIIVVDGNPEHNMKRHTKVILFCRVNWYG